MHTAGATVAAPAAANDANAKPAEPAKPRRVQVHLSTLVLLMFVAAGVLYLNAIEHASVNLAIQDVRIAQWTEKVPEPGEKYEETGPIWSARTHREGRKEFGWPLRFLTQYAAEESESHYLKNKDAMQSELESFYEGKPFTPIQAWAYSTSILPLLLDLLVFVLILVATGIVIEGLHRLCGGLPQDRKSS